MSKKVFENIKMYLNPSTELINRTKEEILPCNYEHKKSIRHGISYKFAIITACFAFIAVIVLIYPYFDTSNGNMLNNKGLLSSSELALSSELASSSGLTSSSELTSSVYDDAVLMGFSVLAYSPKTANQSLTPNYLDETVQTKLKPNIRVLMANFSPLTSSVPGYPFKFVFTQQDSKNVDNYEMRITTNNGELLDWNRETGDITNYGKDHKVDPNKTLFWSPLGGTEIATNANIIISIIKDEKKIGEQIMKIYEENNLYYAITNEIQI